MDQPGLEKRMGLEARRISSQHRKLDALYALVARAVSDGGAAEARTQLIRFGDALKAHFSLEDSFYFPVLHAVRPELKGDLAALSRDHTGLRDELAELHRLLSTGDLSACHDRLDQFVNRLARHESREEQILARIQGLSRTGEAD